MNLYFKPSTFNYYNDGTDSEESFVMPPEEPVSNDIYVYHMFFEASSKSQRKKVLWPQQYRRYIELCLRNDCNPFSPSSVSRGILIVRECCGMTHFFSVLEDLQMGGWCDARFQERMKRRGNNNHITDQSLVERIQNNPLQATVTDAPRWTRLKVLLGKLGSIHSFAGIPGEWVTVWLDKLEEGLRELQNDLRKWAIALRAWHVLVRNGPLMFNMDLEEEDIFQIEDQSPTNSEWVISHLNSDTSYIQR
ncbi:hypothetical protein EV361DRAFT_873679 [Lentinula raphanica]|nr:hypothetical protein EV361DRAFT_873679 [Lentinula raphanica]